MRRTVWAALLALLPPPAAAQDAGDMTAIERLIALENPCRDLRTDLLSLDVVDEVRLAAATLRLEGGTVTASLAGRLSCRTGPGALLAADAALSVAAAARVELDGCAVGGAEVRLSRFGGTLGPILEAGAPLLEVALEETLRDALARLCRDLP